MVNIRNTSIFKNIHDRLNIRDGLFLDNELMQKINPVINIDQPVTDIVKATTSAGTTGTIYTTPTDKDFYLNSAALFVSKDALFDMASSQNFTIVAAPAGGPTQLIAIMSLPNLTLTAGNYGVALNFNQPIKIARGTNIQVARGTSTAGNAILQANISGYLFDSI